jgi:copper chaperone CopZ
MKTIAIDVGDLLTALGPDEVGRRIGEVPGVESVSVDHAAQSATVPASTRRLPPRPAEVTKATPRPAHHERVQDRHRAIQDTGTMTSTRATRPQCFGTASGFRLP